MKRARDPKGFSPADFMEGIICIRKSLPYAEYAKQLGWPLIDGFYYRPGFEKKKKRVNG